MFQRILEAQKDEKFMSTCEKVTICRGNEKKTLNYKIPSCILMLIDIDYYKKCHEMDKEYSVGLDEIYESFEGYENFLKDFINGTREINFPQDADKIHTASRFGYKNFYDFASKVNKKINKCSPLVIESFIESYRKYYIDLINYKTFLSIDDEIIDKIIEGKRYNDDYFCMSQDDFNSLTVKKMKKLRFIEVGEIMMEIGNESIYLWSEKQMNIKGGKFSYEKSSYQVEDYDYEVMICDSDKIKLKDHTLKIK